VEQGAGPRCGAGAAMWSRVRIGKASTW
jgi:hypothetical protein